MRHKLLNWLMGPASLRSRLSKQRLSFWRWDLDSWLGRPIAPARRKWQLARAHSPEGKTDQDNAELTWFLFNGVDGLRSHCLVKNGKNSCFSPFTHACQARAFSRERLRRVLRKKAAVVIHLHTLTSADLHLHTLTFADLHLHTLTFADLHLHTLTSADLHLHTLTSADLHLHTLTSADLHLYTFAPADLHLHTLTSADLDLYTLTSADLHLHTLTPADLHLHTLTSADLHLHTFTSADLLSLFFLSLS